MNKKVIILLCIILLIIPIALNFIIQIHALFPIIGEPVNWLMFWATYLGAAASFVMIAYTSITLKQNREQLDVMKKQWEEEHRPELVAFLFGANQTFYIRIKNVSMVPVRDISILFTHEPKEEYILNWNSWKQRIEDLNFSIEPNGYRDIQVFASFYRSEQYNDYIGLKFTFNNGIIYDVNLSFDSATLLESQWEEKALISGIQNLSETIKNKKLM